MITRHPYSHIAGVCMHVCMCVPASTCVCTRIKVLVQVDTFFTLKDTIIVLMHAALVLVEPVPLSPSMQCWRDCRREMI